MKHLICLTAFIICCQFSFAQVQSNCTDHTELISKAYQYDIHYLAVQRLRWTGHPDNDLIRVPKIHTDSILRALTAVFNTGKKLKADSVFDKYCVHEKYAIYNSLEILLDTNASWINSWNDGITQTGNDTLDNLLKEYGYTLDKEANYYKLVSDQLVNRFALSARLEKFSGIKHASPIGFIRPGISGEWIFYNVRNNNQEVDFYKPFRYGGYNAHRWIYTVSENCTVSLEDTVYYLNLEPLEPYPVPTNCNISKGIVKQGLELYPNPTNSQAIIRTTEDGLIKLFTLSGRVLKSYISYKGYTPIDLSELANGIYIIQHKTTRGSIEFQKIIKE